MGKVMAREELAGVLQENRAGKTVVFTNGCFDLLHIGHIDYLEKARALGDILIVGVNDDASVARLKGPGRPIQPHSDRMRALAALSAVDYSVGFSEDTPVAIIRELRPDIHAKGGDYKEEDLPETEVVKDYGGRVVILPFVPDRSTTGLIERIIADAVERLSQGKK